MRVLADLGLQAMKAVEQRGRRMPIGKKIEVREAEQALKFSGQIRTSYLIRSFPRLGFALEGP